MAAEVLPGIATARTPERTAELEALAEKHNGFLFGELVRPTALPSLKLLLPLRLPLPPPRRQMPRALCPPPGQRRHPVLEGVAKE